jgi:hypothetical protein
MQDLYHDCCSQVAWSQGVQGVMKREIFPPRQGHWSPHGLSPSTSINRFLSVHDQSTSKRSQTRRIPLWSSQSIRRSSPFIAPLLIGSSTFSLLVLFVLMAPTDWQVATKPELLGPFFFIYAALGVIVASALAYAPNETIWALTMILSLCVFIILTTWGIFGLPVTAVLATGLLLLLFAVIRTQVHTVLENTVHIMVQFGKYHRTLYPGFNLRFPGEKVIAIISTGEVPIDVQVQDIMLCTSERIDITATAQCRVIPKQAHRLISHAQDWPEQVKHSLEIAIRTSLSDPEADDICVRGLLDTGIRASANMRVRGHLQQIINSQGIVVEWVRLHSLKPTVPANSTFSSISSSPLVPTQCIPDVVDPGRTMRAGSAPAIPLPFSSVLQMKPYLSPDALAEAYNAVRERRITDPQIIHRIAYIFETAAHDKVLGSHLPFDAIEAAQNLRQLANRLGRG